MARISEQVEWLSLVDISGPFIAAPLLEDVFPQGLDKVEAPRRQRLRAAYDEWRDAVDEDDPDIPALHAAWVRMVLQEALEYEDEVLVPRNRLDGKLDYRVPEHGVAIAPDFAVRGDDGKPRLLVAVHPPETDLEKPLPGDRWPASPLERMTLLCRAHGVRVGLVTDGERWTVVNAPVGGTSGHATWLARLWWQEPVTFRAFVSLLGVRRCFGAEDQRLDRLLDKSIDFQQQVTDTLGEQVRRAVEVLIQALGRADQDRDGELLKDVGPAELYEAGLTVMMRLVFLLCAEERGLLLLGDPVYDQCYAISTLRSALRAEESLHGPEVLERRYDAWSRMLAVFRAVYGGIEHETLRLPALGGSLFDPDRFPFLEGRPKGTSWRDTPADPLPIDNRTVLLLLTALQVLEHRGGAQLLSYRALDVEQIGHVYEGLLEYTAARVPEVTVGLVGSKKIAHPVIALAELAALHSRGREAAVERLVEITGRSASAIRNALDRGGDDDAFIALVQACGGDEALARRLLPFAGLIRPDSWGHPLVYRAGSFAVARGADRRETGTHYTPRFLTEIIVEKTLEPIVYEGPADGKPREQWRLRPPAELLDLKICDPAMGSGAFLVQACRYLSERLVEAWGREEEAGRFVTADGEVVEAAGSHELLPKDVDERLLIARRLVAERCLYGVDLNPLAVELAKLSIWLVTMAKGRPFAFLDHNLRCGDSLLGIHRLDQLTKLTMAPDRPDRQQRLFGRNIEAAVEKAIELRMRLRQIRIRDIRDVEAMAHLHAEARHLLEAISLIADALIGEALRSRGNAARLEAALDGLAMQTEAILRADEHALRLIRERAMEALAMDSAAGKSGRRTFHWPLAFPEVFTLEPSGFDVILGNPPWASYSGRQAVSLAKTDEEYYAATYDLFEGWKALHSLFIERAMLLVCHAGSIGLLLPAQVADLDGYKHVREAVRRLHDVREPLPYFGETAFASVVQPTCALIAVGPPRPVSTAEASLPFIISGRPSSSAEAAGARVSELNEIILLLEKHERPPSRTFSDPGIHSGNCSKKIILASPIGRCAPIREGRNVFPCILEPATKWLRLDYIAAEGEYFTIRPEQVYRRVPILLRQTANRPIAALHTSPTYFRNSVLACNGIDGVLAEAIVAWLNSTAVGIFHVAKVREANQKAFPQVKVRHLQDLPMPEWTPDFMDEARTLYPLAATGNSAAQDKLDRAVSRAFGLSDSQHAVICSALASLLSG